MTSCLCISMHNWQQIAFAFKFSYQFILRLWVRWKIITCVHDYYRHAFWHTLISWKSILRIYITEILIKLFGLPTTLPSNLFIFSVPSKTFYDGWNRKLALNLIWASSLTKGSLFLAPSSIFTWISFSDWYLVLVAFRLTFCLITV